MRDFIPGEQAELRRVFMSSVHELARGQYTEEQLNAWAPRVYDERQWASRMDALRPFVAVISDRVAGYADLQASGRIDHFFVSADFPRSGVGTALMKHIQNAAIQRQVSLLSAHVSLAAESFFARHGFSVEQRQTVIVNGVSLNNAFMTRRLPPETPNSE